MRCVEASWGEPYGGVGGCGKGYSVGESKVEVKAEEGRECSDSGSKGEALFS